MADWTTGGLWLAIIGSGLYHGVNPGMGWPLAVSAAMMGGGRRGMASALGALAFGHLLAMFVILLPFAALMTVVIWQREIRIAAGLLVIAAGVFLFIYRRHPRFIARIRPTQLAFWSFAVAAVHGAGLMIAPIYLGLCEPGDADAGHVAAAALIGANLRMAALVAAVHTAAMLAAGGAVAFAVHRWLGPQFIARSWFNLEIVWAASLVLVGVVGLAAALAGA